ncbi:MAG: sulfotransferase [Gammaproteobacteria bacterium]
MNRSSAPTQAQLGAGLQQAWRMFQSGQYPAAAEAIDRITRAAPESADAWFAASFVKLRLGQRGAALDAIRRASRLRRPTPPGWSLHELVCLDACGLRREGIALGAALVDSEVDDPQFFAILGQALYDLQQFRLARAAQQKALALAPDSPALQLGMASMERALGDLAAAEAACDRCLAAQPRNADALYFRSGLRRQRPDDNHVEALRRLLADPPSDAAAHAKMLYALAKELEDLEAWEESFRALSQGASRYRATLRYDLAEELEFLQAVITTWTAEQVNTPESGPAREGPAPIFVVGLPRTGTTLVERILSAHGQVETAGELPDFSRRMSEMMEKLPQAAGRSRAGMVAASTSLDLDALGERYLEQAAPLAGDGRYFIDKFPQNALYLGLIRRALPESRLVLLWRHPMDTCYSMYKQLFTDIYHFSYDLDELGRYYLAYRSLMKHWAEVLGDRLHVVHYEDLVEDQEGQTRRLLEFCGLDWDPACLEFHRNPAPTTTASASQVRQAMYRSSLGRWRRYRDQLRPLEDRLAAAGALDGWRL